MDINIGLVDDHQLFRKSLELMLASFKGFTVVVDAANGLDLQDKLKTLSVPPDILLIDVQMPVMDGMSTSRWVKDNYPAIKLAALSMNDNDQSIIAMFKAGCCAYLFKDTSPSEFESALNQIHQKGYYSSDHLQLNYARLLATDQQATDEVHFGLREIEFLEHVCSDLTYRQIAKAMDLSVRTVDGYRESLFQKFKVQSRIGIALEAIRRGLVKP